MWVRHAGVRGRTNNCFLPSVVEAKLLNKGRKMSYCCRFCGFQRPQCSYDVFHRCLLKVALDLNSNSVVVSNQLSQMEHKIMDCEQML